MKKRETSSCSHLPIASNRQLLHARYAFYPLRTPYIHDPQVARDISRKYRACVSVRIVRKINGWYVVTFRAELEDLSEVIETNRYIGITDCGEQGLGTLRELYMAREAIHQVFSLENVRAYTGTRAPKAEYDYLPTIRTHCNHYSKSESSIYG
jgi:hypothetical protein